MKKKQYTEFRCPQCSSLLYKYVDSEEPYAGEVKCLKRGCGFVAIRANCVPTKLVELRCQKPFLFLYPACDASTVTKSFLGLMSADGKV